MSVYQRTIFLNITGLFLSNQGTNIGTEMNPVEAIIFMGDVEGQILQDCSFKSLVWWRYIDDIFLLWQHWEEVLELKEVLDI